VTVRAAGSARVVADERVTVQAEDTATVRVDDLATVDASGSAVVRALGNATVRAGGSAKVRAWESATVDAWGAVDVEATDLVTVRARGRVSVKARGTAIVRAHGSVSIEATQLVTVVAHGDAPSVGGGPTASLPDAPSSVEEWCRLHGVSVEDGVATLYKAVDADFRSYNGMSYEPGSLPRASDWDGGLETCGGGLHFSPSPLSAGRYAVNESRYVACPVSLEDTVLLDDKVKSIGVCAPVYEVDEDGRPLGSRPQDGR
jgi:hypothetical protein